MKIKLLVIITLALNLAIFLMLQAEASVGFRFRLEPDPNETQIAAGENLVCSLIIDAADIAPSKISGFSFCISYPDLLIVPIDPETGEEVTADSEPFVHNGDYISTSGLLVPTNERVVVDGTVDGLPMDKLKYSCMTTKESRCGAALDNQLLGTITFKALVDLPAYGYIRWWGLDTPDPDTAAKTAYSIFGDDTSYTPNPHTDISLPVELFAFGAIWLPEGINLLWEAESQCNNLGWNIYRSESKDGSFVKINAQIVEGAGTTGIPKTYKFIDKDAKRGRSYFYYLESISYNGETDKSHIIEVNLLNLSLSWGVIKQSALHSNYSIHTSNSKATTIVRVYDREGKFLRIQRRLPKCLKMLK